MKTRLHRVPIIGANESEERAWLVVAAAFEERTPTIARTGLRKRWVAVLATVVTVAALVAVAVSPAGSEIVRSVRHAVGIPPSSVGLTHLPAPGMLLVDSSSGPWVVHPDGSRRLLGHYQQASWSPHGLFLAVTKPHQLLAVDPEGTVRWAISRQGTITQPRWAPDGYRIAYLNNSSLRIVNGDGTGDHRLATNTPAIAPAWRPSTTHLHILAFITRPRELELVNVDTGTTTARWRLASVPVGLFWSTDGQRLAVIERHGIAVFNNAGRHLHTIRLIGAPGAAAFVPNTHKLTLVLTGGRSETVTIDLDRPDRRPTPVFTGSGSFDSLAWSPNGHWLLLAWPTADQWLLIPSGGQRINAIAAINHQFDSSRGPTPPSIQGWCCAPTGTS